MNWETEQVGHLVSGNYDAGDYEYWQDQAQEALDDADGNRTKAQTALAKQLEDELTEETPIVEGLWGTFLVGALSEVQWREVADIALGDLE